MASLAEKPNRVRAVFYNKEANNAGCYLLKFHINGVPTGVMVDDIFLTDGNRMCFAQCKNGELWVPLIEKAWAKVLGSYTRIDRAFLECEVMHTLTGSPSKYINHAEIRNNTTLKN